MPSEDDKCYVFKSTYCFNIRIIFFRGTKYPIKSDAIMFLHIREYFVLLLSLSSIFLKSAQD